MRTKRIQRRRKAAAPKAPIGHILPDPFSRLNPSLVRAEVEEERWRADMCPCCIDRLAQIECSRQESLYLDDLKEYRRSMRDGLDNRYQDQWPSCGSGFCFCTDCAEYSEHIGEDYEAWRRAFPSLPWDVAA